MFLNRRKRLTSILSLLPRAAGLLAGTSLALAQPAPEQPPPEPPPQQPAPEPPPQAAPEAPASPSPSAPAPSEPAVAAEPSVIEAPGELSAEAAAAQPDEPLAEVVVIAVGSRTPRTRGETPVPVDVVTAEEIRRSGATETGRILASLVPSYFSQPQTIADGSDHVDPASLRGLGPDQVLVLVNGKRRHPSALLHINGTFGRGSVGVDLNAIPSGSIQRIEVLRDGAAYQYGSDAIAGVINIVTRSSTDIVDVSTQVGITAEGDGEQYKAWANYGLPLGDRGFINFTAELLERGSTNRTGRYTGTIFSDDVATDEQLLAESGLSRDDFAMKIGESAATVAMAAFNLELPLTEKAVLYGFGDVAHRFGRAGAFYRFPRQTSQNVPEYYPNGFLPEIDTTITDSALTFGLRGEHAGWHVDLSLTHGSNAFRFNVESSVNASLGTNSPTTFDAGALHFSQTVADLDLRRPIGVPFLKMLSFVAGSELRVEDYRIEAGDEASYSNGGATFGDPPQPKIPGAQGFPGFQPSNEVDRSRNNVGVYTGFESELAEGFSVDLGGRYEHYSDFGSSLIGRVAARAQLLPALALRAAASNGFRAPSLQQRWFNNVATLFLPDASGALAPSQVLTSNNLSPVTRNFGIAPLEEEKSINLSGGFVLQPLEALSITIDGYFIRLKDRIVLTSQFPTSNPAVAALLAPFPSVSQAQFFANAVDTDTLGLDVVAEYTLRLQPSSLTLSAAANFTSTDVRDVHVPPSLLAAFQDSDLSALGTSYFGRAAYNRLEDAIPRQRGTAGALYGLGPFTASLRARFYGEVHYRPDLADNDEDFAAKTLLDAELSYELLEGLRLSLGGENLFNTFPDENRKPANTSSGRFLYNRNVSQFGWNGGFYYAKLRMTLF